ncbi:MAG: hypothetical protein EU533_01125 [Promethearchaeota archaeon]|nr:MAG: hypothetical protein EU533_01125 [Candidatus Lokiarchaeota archaeon]
MKIEHVAVAANSEEDSDEFCIELLGLEKKRTFIVPNDLMINFFGIDKSQKVIRYANEETDFEVFITDDNSRVKDSYTHICLIIKHRDKFVEKAKIKNFEMAKVSREGSSNYYLFIKDKYGNLYEIKSP